MRAMIARAIEALQSMLDWAETPARQASPSWIIGACERARSVRDELAAALSRQAPDPTDAQVIAGLEEALSIMKEHGVDGLSPFSDYPNPVMVTRRVYQAMVRFAHPAPDDGWRDIGSAPNWIRETLGAHVCKTHTLDSTGKIAVVLHHPTSGEPLQWFVLPPPPAERKE